MDERLMGLGNRREETIKRKYNKYGRIYYDVEDFLQHEFKKTNELQFPPEEVNGFTRQFTFKLLQRETDYAVFRVNMTMIGEGRESNYEEKVYLSIRPWEGMEEVLGSDPYTIQIEGKPNVLKQLNPSTWAFSNFFGLCHCHVVTDQF